MKRGFGRHYMDHKNDSVNFVADRARETFLEIRKLRKTLPQFTRAEKDELERRIKLLQDQWWDDVRDRMLKG